VRLGQLALPVSLLPRLLPALLVQLLQRVLRFQAQGIQKHQGLRKVALQRQVSHWLPFCGSALQIYPATGRAKNFPFWQTKQF
jgi:hypothetical protein